MTLHLHLHVWRGDRAFLAVSTGRTDGWSCGARFHRLWYIGSFARQKMRLKLRGCIFLLRGHTRGVGTARFNFLRC